MKFFLTVLFCAGLSVPVLSQRKPRTPLPKPATDSTHPVKPKNPIAGNPKPYKEVIPDSAVTQKGLFTV
ncbi:MAG TPA: DUF5118 domain-containing protein, partial [Puia sp.]